MRDFLMELYLLHGEREFSFKYRNGEHSRLFALAVDKFIEFLPQRCRETLCTYRITPKAIEYIKNLDNP